MTNEQRKALRREAATRGICSAGCKRPAAPDRKLCTTCLENRSKIRYARLTEKLCVAGCKRVPTEGVKCEECKFKHLASRFGLTVEDCRRLLQANQNRCHVCNVEGPLVIDHDHQSGKVRGALCKQCNIALGGARDNVKVLIALSVYLTDPPATRVLQDPQTPIKPRKGR